MDSLEQLQLRGNAGQSAKDDSTLDAASVAAEDVALPGSESSSLRQLQQSTGLSDKANGINAIRSPSGISVAFPASASSSLSALMYHEEYI